MHPTDLDVTDLAYLRELSEWMQAYAQLADAQRSPAHLSALHDDLCELTDLLWAVIDEARNSFVANHVDYRTTDSLTDVTVRLAEVRDLVPLIHLPNLVL